MRTLVHDLLSILGAGQTYHAEPPDLGGTYPTWGADRCALPDITALTANASGTPTIAL